MSIRGSGTKPVSVYLSPKAHKILQNYVNNSGYGSTSRTVEELILSYNSAYQAILTWIVSQNPNNPGNNPQQVVALFFNMLGYFDLENGTPLEKIAKKNLSTTFQERFGVSLNEE